MNRVYQPAALECACLLTAVPPEAIFNAAAELVRKRYQLLTAPGQGPGDMAGWKGTLQKVRRCCRFLGLRAPYSIFQPKPHTYSCQPDGAEFNEAKVMAAKDGHLRQEASQALVAKPKKISCVSVFLSIHSQGCVLI